MGHLRTLQGARFLLRASWRRARWCVRTADRLVGKVLEAVAYKIIP